jgi:hypothetical protein
MQSAIDNSDVTIGRLRLKGARGDGVGERLKLVQMLNDCRLQPRSFAASAILCIRKFNDPLPGVLNLEHERSRPPPSWEHAVATSIEELARRSARPINEAVPAGENAVLFADRAELLACLALDWLTGDIATHWWWHTLFREPSRVAEEWIKAVEYVPPAMDLLSQRESVVAFIHALAEHEVCALLRAVLNTFGLARLYDLLEEEPARQVAKSELADKPSSILQQACAQDSSHRKSIGPAPWEPFVPETARVGPNLERQLCLGITMMLLRMPAVVRSAPFADAVRLWRSASVTHLANDDDEVTRAAKVNLRPSTPGPNASKPRAPFAGREKLGGDRHAVVSYPSGVASTLPDVNVDDQCSPGQLPVYGDDHLHAPSVGDHQDLSRASPSPADMEHKKMRPVTSEAIFAVPRSSEPAIVESELGGLFYLVNFAIYLRLYGDFTSPLAQCLALPLWDFVGLLGCRLLDAQCRDDPVWDLIARLSGREPNEPPGLYFKTPDWWRFPPDGDNESESPAEFISTNLTSTTLLTFWLDWLTPLASARLCRALGVKDMAALRQMLLRHRARIEVSSARLDIHFSLDALPLAVRRCGLDRDPGWIPSAGRSLYFHYE